MKRGFTLIDISIALIILGIITGLSIPLLMQTKGAKHIEIARKELQIYKKRLISFYNQTGNLPSHTPTYTLPHLSLQIPRRFTLDPVSGIPYRYFAETIRGDGDSIYVDGNAIGDIGAVIISPGKNGKFDGENATPDDKRFQSTSTGDFDDILVYVSQAELVITPAVCTSYQVTIINTSGASLYVYPVKSASNYFTMPNGSTQTWPNASPDEYFLISTSTGFTTITTNVFVPKKYDINGNCRVYINVYRRVSNVPIFTTDLD